jgi:hypothetical protein
MAGTDTCTRLPISALHRECVTTIPTLRRLDEMICSIVANGNLHVFQVTASGDLVHRSHTAGTGDFPSETITNGCDPKVAPTAEIFNNNLHVFAQNTGGEIVWGLIPHGGKPAVKVLGN